ncbi:chemotaxis protein CheC [Cupriavidus sp. 30B13]|uniref:chemotaxis protein n=1 Tax=Cupriavidus sp. 30B13 TaxID=3384241 RepID=UPI003B8FAA25
MTTTMTERGARDSRKPQRVPARLGADRRDALQELANIGMGAAGAKLACLLDRFVTLSIPRISVVDPKQIKEEIERQLGGMPDMAAFRQSFRSDIAGETMVFFGRDGARDLCEAFYGRKGMAAEGSREMAFRGLLLEVANVLAGACVSGLLGQLGRVPTFSVPREIDAQQVFGAIARSGNPAAGGALLLDLHIRIEGSRFKANLVALLAQSAIDRLCVALDEFLASL